MARSAHAAHRFHPISRCLTCRRPLLLGCTYRSRRFGLCIETRGAYCEHHPYRGPLSRRFDYAAAARRIFGDDLADTLPLGETP